MTVMMIPSVPVSVTLFAWGVFLFTVAVIAWEFRREMAAYLVCHWRRVVIAALFLLALVPYYWPDCSTLTGLAWWLYGCYA